MANSITITTAKTLKQAENIINRGLTNIQSNTAKIAYALKDIKENSADWLGDTKFSDYVENTFDFKRSFAEQLVSVATTHSFLLTDGYSPSKAYEFRKLDEENTNACIEIYNITPDTTTKEIRRAVKEYVKDDETDTTTDETDTTTDEPTVITEPSNKEKALNFIEEIYNAFVEYDNKRMIDITIALTELVNNL